jgi:hypothetical protein
MTEAAKATPKLFISYSWSSPEHEAWVVDFASQLVNQGIEVIFDKWDLQPGHDSYAFMEAIVTDPTVNKVLLICDESYVQKSDGRNGGAGTEAQIITPRLYNNVKQDKFVAIALTKDENGKARLPAYYGGRIYIDFTDSSSRSTEFDRVVRWAWGKPLHERPTMGPRPSFLSRDPNSSKINSTIAFRRALDAIRNHAPHTDGSVREYLDILSDGLENFRITANIENQSLFDEMVVQSINDFEIYRNEAVELFQSLSSNGISDERLTILHRFFEGLIPYMGRPANVDSWLEESADNYRFIIHELFICFIGSLLKYEQLETAATFLDTQYYTTTGRRQRGEMESYHVFREFMATFRSRNTRLQSRRTSIRADMLKSRSAGRGLEFGHLMAADFVLYFRGQASRPYHQSWWPETLVYSERFGGTLEIFTRAQSKKYFDRVMTIFGLKDKSDLNKLVQEIESDRDRIPRWDYSTLNLREVLGLDGIATKP